MMSEVRTSSPRHQGRLGLEACDESVQAILTLFCTSSSSPLPALQNLFGPEMKLRSVLNDLLVQYDLESRDRLQSEHARNQERLQQIQAAWQKRMEVALKMVRKERQEKEEAKQLWLESSSKLLSVEKELEATKRELLERKREQEEASAKVVELEKGKELLHQKVAMALAGSDKEMNSRAVSHEPSPEVGGATGLRAIEALATPPQRERPLDAETAQEPELAREGSALRKRLVARKQVQGEDPQAEAESFLPPPCAAACCLRNLAESPQRGALEEGGTSSPAVIPDGQPVTEDGRPQKGLVAALARFFQRS